MESKLIQLKSIQTCQNSKSILSHPKVAPNTQIFSLIQSNITRIKPWKWAPQMGKNEELKKKKREKW